MANMSLAERMKNETPEQREARLAKAKATREANKEKNALKRRERKLVTAEMNRLLKSKFKIKDKDSPNGVSFVTGAALVGATLFKDATTPGGKNTVPAQKLLLELVGENKEEAVSNNIVVQFNNSEKIDV